MEEQPKGLSAVIIKHRVKLYQNNPGLIDKMIIAGKKIKPALMITPQFSFPNENCVDEAYELLKKESPSTVLVTSRNNALIKTPEPEFDPLESLDYQVLVYPYDDKKFLNLDLLINIGEAEPEEVFRNDRSLRIGGYLIRIMDDINNFIVRKIIKNREAVLDPAYPVPHKNAKAYDWYVLRMD